MRRLATALALALCAALPGLAAAQGVSPDLQQEIAPRHTLRAAINLGNSVLATRSGETLSGISVDLAHELGRRLALPVELLPYDSAGQVTDAGKAGAWDVAFLAVDPVRGQGIAFTAPYVVIEGAYMVAEGSPLQRVEDVDRPGIRIAVGRGSAYDLYLTRAIKQAELVRAPTSPAAIDLFVRDHLDVAANVKQPLVAYVHDHPGFRVVPGRFMAIEQAMGVPKGREHAAAFLRDFVERVKASGFVAEAIGRNHQPDAVPAPPASAAP